MSFDLLLQRRPHARSRGGRQGVSGHAIHPRPLRQRRRPRFPPNGRRRRNRARRRWEEGLAALAERPNVACKISGVLEAAAPDKLTADDVARVVNPCLDRFGPDRVVFASNWPVCNRGGTFREWVEILAKVTGNRSQAHQRKLFSSNALRWYRLG